MKRAMYLAAFVMTLLAAVSCLSLVIAVSASWIHPESPGDVVSGASGVVGASVAVLGALAGVKTWQDDRAANREQRARDGYDELIGRIGEQYTLMDPVKGQLMAARGRVAVWGSPAVVEAAAAWNRLYDVATARAVRSGDGFVLQPQDADALGASYLKLVETVRAEVGNFEVEGQTLHSTLFNDLPK